MSAEIENKNKERANDWEFQGLGHIAVLIEYSG